MKKVLSALISSSLILPSLGKAVGLGPLTVNSALNENFSAEVRLLSLQGVPLSGIDVSLAGEDQFKRAGIARPLFLDQLKFETAKNQYGHPIIKITSEDRISEPYVQFLMDVTWAEGQLFRAYTVLLDPPNYAFAPDDRRSKAHLGSHTYNGKTIATKTTENTEKTAKTEKITKPEKTATIVKQQSATNVAKTTAAEPPVVAVAATAEKKPPVKPVAKSDIKPAKPAKPLVDTVHVPAADNKDLWEIAVQFRPNENITIAQTMLAILGMNPKAFSNDNVNGLKKGFPLKIPQQEVIETIPKALAEKEINYQNKVWQNQQAKETKLLSAPYFKPNANSNSNPASVQLPERITPQRVASNSFIPEILLVAKTETERTLVKEMALNTEAVNSIKQSNDSLALSMEELQKNNQALIDRLTQKEKELSILHQAVNQLTDKNAQLQSMVTGNMTQVMKPAKVVASVNPQVIEQSTEPESESWGANFILGLLVLTLVAGSGTTIMFWLRRKWVMDSDMADDEFDGYPSGTDDEFDSLDDSLEVESAVEETIEQEQAPEEERLTQIEEDEPELVGQEFTPTEGLSLEDETPSDMASDKDQQQPSEESFDSLSSEDVVASKLDLATAYVGMEDYVAAEQLLKEIVQDGNLDQKHEAEKLLKDIADKM